MSVSADAATRPTPVPWRRLFAAVGADDLALGAAFLLVWEPLFAALEIAHDVFLVFTFVDVLAPVAFVSFVRLHRDEA
jgi:hypothetical protein